MEKQEVSSALADEGQPKETVAGGHADGGDAGTHVDTVVDAGGDEDSAAEPASGEILAEELYFAESTGAEDASEARLKAVIESVIYVTDEPLSAAQIAAATQQPAARVERILEELTAEFNKPEHGLTVREVAGGYKMATKPEHHEAIRAFVKNLKPPLKLSLAALETLAVIAYKQPVTAPEIGDIRGVQGASVLKTLIDRKLIAPSGRKAVVGKPILYKTTKEFLIQFGLKDLTELPTLKEFEEIGKLALGDPEMETPVIPDEAPAPAEAAPPSAEETEQTEPADSGGHAEPATGSE